MRIDHDLLNNNEIQLCPNNASKDVIEALNEQINSKQNSHKMPN